MADDIEQKLKFIIESVGVKQTKKDLEEINKSTSFLKKHMLGVGVAIGGAAAALGLLFRSSSVVQSVMSAVNDIFFGFIDMILVELMPVIEPLLTLFQELLNDALKEIIPIVKEMVVWFKDNLLPVLEEYKPELKELIKLFGLIVAGGMLVFLGALVIGMIAAGEIVRDLKIAFGDLWTFAIVPLANALMDLWNNVLAPFGNWIKNTIQPIWDAFAEAIKIVVGGIQTVSGGIGAAGEAVGGFFDWAAGGLGLQHGGIVTGPTRALIGEAGPEAVIPLDQLGGGLTGPVTINLVVDGRIMASTILETLRRDQQLTLRSVI